MYLCWSLCTYICMCFAERALCKSATIRRCVTRAARTHRIRSQPAHAAALSLGRRRSTPECSVIMESGPIFARADTSTTAPAAKTPLLAFVIRASHAEILGESRATQTVSQAIRILDGYDEMRLDMCAPRLQGRITTKCVVKGAKSTSII